MIATLDRTPFASSYIAVSLAAYVLAAAFATAYFAWSLLLGIMLEWVNFVFLRRSCRRVLSGSSSGLIGNFGVRFVLLAVVVGLALSLGCHPIGLLVGLSVVVPSGIIAAWRVRPLPLSSNINSEEYDWDNWDPWRAQERDLEEGP